jgi:hypothetical protein
MSTIRATYVQHGSSAVPNITLNASGQVIVASGIVSSGTFAAPTGSAAAPGVYFVGDTNTGLYSPGADQVAISTNGTGRLFVDASGNVGVGGAPTQLLQLGSFGGNDSNLQFAANTAGASNILFGDGSSGADFYRGLIKYNHATDSLELLASSYSTIITNGSERLRITSAGLVGIGTSSPQKLAHISNTYNAPTGGHNAETFLIVSNGLTNSNACGIEIQGGRSGASFIEFGDPDNADVGRIVYSHSANSLATIVNGSVATFIDSSGRVGIGTTTPGAQLSVYGDSADSVQAYIENNNAAGASASNRRLRLAHGGTAAPVAVWQNAGVVESTGAGGGLALGAYSAASTDPITFYTGPGRAERARIDGSGRLLVGTSSSSNLYAIGGANFAPKVQIQGTDPIELGVQRTDGPPYVHIANGQSGLASGNDVGFISFNGKDSNNLLVQAAQISAAVDGTPGANDMPGRLVFSVTPDGSASPTEAMRIDSQRNAIIGTTTTNIGTGFASKTNRLLVGNPTGVGGGIGAFGFTSALSGTVSFVVGNNGAVRVTIYSTANSASARIGHYIIVGLNKGAGNDPVVQSTETNSPNWTFSYSNNSGDTLVTVTAPAAESNFQGMRVIVEPLGS